MARQLRILTATVALMALAFGSVAAAPALQEPHRACIQASSGGRTWYYDLRADAAGTTLDRWTLDGGAAYIDRNSYAALHLPEGGSTAWDEGVSFAATMQTRNAWLNTEQTNAANWVYDAAAGHDTMTFHTTVNGGAQEFVFRTSQCQDLTAPGGSPPPATTAQPPATPTNAPEPTATNAPQTPSTTAAPSGGSGVYRACIQASSGGHTWYYDIRSDPSNEASGTTMERWTLDGTPTRVDSNTYAAFHKPVEGSTTWDEGVSFAAAMQSRQVWLNTEQTSGATWTTDASSGAITWTFHTTVNGGAQEYIFTTAQCQDRSPSGSETDAPAPTEAPATTTAAPSGVSCPSYGGYNVKQCSAEEDCCGYNTMSPQCVSKTSGDKCCTWFKSATTCNSTQSCCGMMGPGASSYAFCCNEGTECCQARTGYSGTATCCPTGTKCCSAASVGLCCAMDEECDVNGNRCVKSNSTAA
jgi:hypothetical protein